jgi:thiol:disulfide interchange protein
MPTTPSTPQHIDSYSIISFSGHRLTSSSGKWGLVLLAPISVQASGNYIPYSPQAVKTALGQGCAVLLDFTAKW